MWSVSEHCLQFVVVGRQTFVLNAPTIFPQAALLHFPADQVLVVISVFTDLDKRWQFEIILGVARFHEQLKLAAMGGGIRQLTLDLAPERHLDVVRSGCKSLYILLVSRAVVCALAYPCFCSCCRDLGSARPRNLDLSLTLLQLLRRCRAWAAWMNMRVIDAAVCSEVAFAWSELVHQPLQACAQPSSLMELSPAGLMHTQVESSVSLGVARVVDLCLGVVQQVVECIDVVGAVP